MKMPSDWWRNELYSQFGEDGIILGYFRRKWYAKYRHIESFETGFYVDIGAHHPFMLSNTWYFYQRGWSGINVDPSPGTKADFDLHRPRDINLEIAIASHDGTATLYTNGGRSVSNSLLAGKSDQSNTSKRSVVAVETQRLETLLKTHLLEGQKIDLLSIDVEGLDLAVLQSSDWIEYRPELVVIENHCQNVHSLIRSEIYTFMVDKEYELYGWAQPSLIFCRKS